MNIAILYGACPRFVEQQRLFVNEKIVFVEVGESVTQSTLILLEALGVTELPAIRVQGQKKNDRLVCGTEAVKWMKDKSGDSIGEVSVIPVAKLHLVEDAWKNRNTLFKQLSKAENKETVETIIKQFDEYIKESCYVFEDAFESAATLNRIEVLEALATFSRVTHTASDTARLLRTAMCAAAVSGSTEVIQVIVTEMMKDPPGIRPYRVAVHAAHALEEMTKSAQGDFSETAAALLKVVQDTGGDITFTLVRALENAAASRKPRIATLIIATLDTTVVAPRVTKLHMMSRPLEMTVYTGDDELANSILTAMKKFARNASDLQHAMVDAVHAAKHMNHTGFQTLLNIDNDNQDLAIQDTLFQRFFTMFTNFLPEITVVVIIIMFLVCMFVQNKN